MKKVAVLQSNYVPWKGYFDIIRQVDVCVFYDDVQYTKGDWRNRNRIKTCAGTQWLTVPVGASINRTIDQVEIPHHRWQAKHWKSISQNYSQARYFNLYRRFLENVYGERRWSRLHLLNQYLIREIAHSFLGLTAEFRSATEFSLTGRNQSRLLSLLQQVGADVYLSGPSGGDYLDSAEFAQKNIELQFISYNNYPQYDQPHPPFQHQVSILDLLFCTGPEAINFCGPGSRAIAA